MRDDEQRAFTQTLGKLRLGTVKAEGEQGLMKVTHDRKENPVYAEFFPGTFFWHFDGPYEEVPPFATVLTPRVLSETGGNTEFANTYAAYEDLPDDEKAFLDTLQGRAHHAIRDVAFLRRPHASSSSPCGAATRRARSRWSGATARGANHWSLPPRPRASSACTWQRVSTCCNV